MSLVTTRLYIGDIENARDLNFLKSKNIGTIVNCTNDIENFHTGQFNYMNLNLVDSPSQDLSKVLDPVADKIIELIKSGEVVFIHCYAGVSRSSSIMIYTLMKLHNWNFDKAHRFTKMMHPRTNPNDGFIEQLVMRNKTNESFINTKSVNFEEQVEESSEEEVLGIADPSTYEAPKNLYKDDEVPKKWTSMKLDSTEDELPDFTKMSKGRHKPMYARVFS